jgi:hypothetical protein
VIGYLVSVLLTCPICSPHELDGELMACFENVSKLRTVRFNAILYSNRYQRVSPDQKNLDGLWQVKTAEGIIDLPSGCFRFKESTYDDKFGKCLNRSRSWCDGELRAFTEKDSPLLQAANLEAPGGSIDLEPLDYARFRVPN